MQSCKQCDVAPQGGALVNLTRVPWGLGFALSPTPESRLNRRSSSFSLRAHHQWRLRVSFFSLDYTSSVSLESAWSALMWSWSLLSLSIINWNLNLDFDILHFPESSYVMIVEFRFLKRENLGLMDRAIPTILPIPVSKNRVPIIYICMLFSSLVGGERKSHDGYVLLSHFHPPVLVFFLQIGWLADPGEATLPW